MPTATIPTAVISNATRIWELNIQWPMYAQCGVWDTKGRGVDIWECIQARKSPSSCMLYDSPLTRIPFQMNRLQDLRFVLVVAPPLYRDS